MVKRRTKVYGPEIGRRFCTFIDDLNMPKKEEYGAQPPIEIIRQFCDYNGWYERRSKEKPFWKIEDMTLLVAMGPPGGGRSVISPRLQRHFNILTFTDLQDEAIRTIYKAIGSAFYSPFVEEVRDCLDPLIEAQLEIYD
jgi:dynein heavy chain